MPRYDEQTRRLMEQHLHLAGATVLTCTVYEERPLRLRREEVGTSNGACEAIVYVGHIMSYVGSSSLSTTTCCPCSWGK